MTHAAFGQVSDAICLGSFYHVVGYKVSVRRSCLPFILILFWLGPGGGGGGGGGGDFKLTYSGVLIFYFFYLLSPDLCFGVLVHKDQKRVQVFQQIEKFH